MIGQNLQGDCSTPKPMSEIESQLTFCEKESGRLGEVIAKLSSKLSPILRVNPPTQSPDQKDVIGLTPLANQIRSIGNGFKLFSRQIESILERLEL